MIKLNKEFFAGVVVGFGAGLVSKGLPNGGAKGAEDFFKNLAKNAMKFGISGAAVLKTQAAQFKETVEDIVAEAHEEAAAPKKPKNKSAKPKSENGVQDSIVPN